MLPTHLMPVVEMTRWPWMVMASAPPDHRALTTAWMSCWWTTSRSASTPFAATEDGASSRVTETVGPVTAVSPAAASAALQLLRQVGAGAGVLRVGEGVDLGAQVGDLPGELGVLPRLVGDEAHQVGVAARAAGRCRGRSRC